MVVDRKVVVFSGVWASNDEIMTAVSILKEITFSEEVVFLISKNCDFDFDDFSDSISVRIIDEGDSYRAALKGCQPGCVIFVSHNDVVHGIKSFGWLEKKPFYMALHVYNLVEKNSLNENIYNKKIDVNAVVYSSLRQKMLEGNGVRLQNVMLLERELGGMCKGEVVRYAIDCLFGLEQRAGTGKIYKDYSDIRLSYITHFYCNQNDICSVVDLLRRYEKYPGEVKSKVQFVIVDDGSPIDYVIPDFDLNLTWIKINQDIKWNQAGARNLGVVYAKSDKILLTDLDHEIPVESMRRLVDMKSCGKRLYKVYRKDPDCVKHGGKLYKGHSNLFVLSRGRFMECFGYDEEFAGAYGAEDVRFAKYQKISGTLQTYLPKSITCFERTDINRGASYHSLARDLTFNTPVDSRKRYEFSEFGNGYGHSRSFLNFTWDVKKECYFSEEIDRRRDRSWKFLSFFRQIMPRF